MNEGERQALLNRVMHEIAATEIRLRRIGLQFVKVGLFDERTRQPINHHDELLDMAEGKEPPEVIAQKKQAEEDKRKAAEYAARANGEPFFRQLDEVKEEVEKANTEQPGE